MSPEAARKLAPIELRQARADDGARLWRLVEQMGGLELNTAYFYLLYCRDHAQTTLIAECAGVLAGFVLAHRPPPRPQSLFVWQIGVAPAFRQRGVGATLLEGLLADPQRDWSFLEASVSPDNRASRRLFSSLAERHHRPCAVSPYLSAEQFPQPHPREDLLRIGPFAIDGKPSP